MLKFFTFVQLKIKKLLPGLTSHLLAAAPEHGALPSRPRASPHPDILEQSRRLLRPGRRSWACRRQVNDGYCGCLRVEAGIDFDMLREWRPLSPAPTVSKQYSVSPVELQPSVGLRTWRPELLTELPETLVVEVRAVEAKQLSWKRRNDWCSRCSGAVPADVGSECLSDLDGQWSGVTGMERSRSN